MQARIGSGVRCAIEGPHNRAARQMRTQTLYSAHGGVSDAAAAAAVRHAHHRAHTLALATHAPGGYAAASAFHSWSSASAIGARGVHSACTVRRVEPRTVAPSATAAAARSSPSLLRGASHGLHTLHRTATGWPHTMTHRAFSNQAPQPTVATPPPPPPHPQSATPAAAPAAPAGTAAAATPPPFSFLGGMKLPPFGAPMGGAPAAGTATPAAPGAAPTPPPFGMPPASGWSLTPPSAGAQGATPFAGFKIPPVGAAPNGAPSASNLFSNMVKASASASSGAAAAPNATPSADAAAGTPGATATPFASMFGRPGGFTVPGFSSGAGAAGTANTTTAPGETPASAPFGGFGGAGFGGGKSKIMDALSRRHNQTQLGVASSGPVGRIVPGASATISSALSFADVLSTTREVKKKLEEGVDDPVVRGSIKDLDAEHHMLNSKTTTRSKPPQQQQQAAPTPKKVVERRTLSTDVDPTRAPPDAPSILPMEAWVELRQARGMKAELVEYAAYQREAKTKWEQACQRWSEEMRVSRLTQEEEDEMAEQHERQARVERMRLMASMGADERIEFQMKLEEEEARKEMRRAKKRAMEQKVHDIDQGMDVPVTPEGAAAEQVAADQSLDQPSIRPIQELETIDARPVSLWPLQQRFQRMTELRQQALAADHVRELREERLRTMAGDVHEQRKQGNADAEVNEDERNALLRALNEDDAALLSVQTQIAQLSASLVESQNMLERHPTRLELKNMATSYGVSIEHLNYSLSQLGEDAASIAARFDDPQPLQACWKYVESMLASEHQRNINGDASQEEMAEQGEQESMEQQEGEQQEVRRQDPREMDEDEMEAAREAEMDGETSEGGSRMQQEQAQRFRKPRKHKAPVVQRQEESYDDEVDYDPNEDEDNVDEYGGTKRRKVPGSYADLEAKYGDRDPHDDGEEDEDGEYRPAPKTAVRGSNGATPAVTPAVPWSLRDQRQSMGKVQKNASIGYARRVRDMYTKEKIEVFHIQTLASLAGAMQVSLAEITKKLKELDLSARGSTGLVKEDVARLLVEEFGHEPFKSEVIQPQEVANLRRKSLKSDDYLALPLRAPVICVMGHVDHGKTTLMDRLRSENRAAGEAGGITQAIGAFRVDLNADDAESSADRPSFATFLDTPGHAAFKNMRAKGASSACTDLVILVISAVDGLMPQTLEVIQLARKANLPLIVAINKCDIAGADPAAVQKQLLVHDVVVEDLGGEVLSCNISAKTGDGIQQLKELIAVTAEILQLHADRTCPAEAYVIESRVHKKGGCVASVLVRNGSLRVGQYFVCGLQYGRIRALHDERDRPIRDGVHPGEAVQLFGLKSLEDLTEDLYVVESEEMALRVLAERQALLEIDESDLLGSIQAQNQADQKAQAYKIQVTRRRKRIAIRPMTTEEHAAQTLVDQAVPVLVKADVSGSMEVLLDYFSKLPRDEVMCSIIKSGLGEITAADVEYAASVGGGPTIFGFNVKATSDAVLLAKQLGIRIFAHSVIYSLWDDVRDLLSDKLPVEMEEAPMGLATVAQIFPITDRAEKKKKAKAPVVMPIKPTGVEEEDAAAAAAAAEAAAQAALEAEAPPVVAGCRVKHGKLDAKMRFRLRREDEVIIQDAPCVSLRINRDAKPVVDKGQECGLRLGDRFDSAVRVGDTIECFTMVRKKKELDDSAARGFIHDSDNVHQQAAFYE